MAVLALAHCGHDRGPVTHTAPAAEAPATEAPVVASPADDDAVVDDEPPTEIERTPAAFTVAEWLGRNPDVETVSAYRLGPYRLVRVRNAAGSTFCVVRHDTADPASCWLDERAIETMSSGLAEAEVDGELLLVELSLGTSEGVQRSQIDVPRRMRRRAAPASEAPPGPRPPLAPFWSGERPEASRNAPGTFGDWEPLPIIDPPVWLHLFRRQDAYWVSSSGSARAIEVSDELGSSDAPGASVLCVRAGDWACVSFAVTREDWELVRSIERIEALDAQTFVVQSSMRMDGGNGEGSGAYGSSELYVVTALDGALTVTGFLPLGGMEWTTEQLCDWDSPCYHRAVRRAYHPWSVDAAGCISLAPARAESVTADGSFVTVRRAGGRAWPVRRLRGRDAIATVALGFPGDEAAHAFVAPTDDLTGSYRWDGSRLVRDACAGGAD